VPEHKQTQIIRLFLPNRLGLVFLNVDDHNRISSHKV
jgi:hypothetical protein